jgi:hypothetical protein
LYNLREDFSQYNNLALQEKDRLEAMKALFLEQAKENHDLPIGAGIWLRLHPEDAITSPYKSWVFNASTTRMPEFSAPGLGKKSNKVIIDMEVRANENGVIYALGGGSGGLTFFMEDGRLVYEYNMMIIERYTVETPQKLPPGKHHIEVLTKIAKPGAPASIEILVDGKTAVKGNVARTVPAAFTASESFDVGTDLGSPVSLRYQKKAPFKFSGKINSVKIELL